MGCRGQPTLDGRAVPQVTEPGTRHQSESFAISFRRGSTFHGQHKLLWWVVGASVALLLLLVVVVIIVVVAYDPGTSLIGGRVCRVVGQAGHPQVVRRLA